MRLVPVTRAWDGAELGRDVLIGRPDGIPLLRAGARLTSRYRERLLAAGVMAIYIEDEESAGIEVEHLVSDHTRALATQAVAGAYDSVTIAVRSGQPLAADAAESLREVVSRMLEEIDSSTGVALALADLASADAYTLQHSIDVAAIGLLIGQRHFRDHGWIDAEGRRRFDAIDDRLHTFGLGLLLHDIGKLTIPQTVLLKEGPLTPPEWELIKTHPRAGVDLLSGGAWSPLVKAVVLRHHERWNGSGYPDGRPGEATHQMARLAAVADVYDAVTSMRVYSPAKPEHVGVKVILEGAGTLFDPDVVDSFRRVVAPFPPGAEVKLIDGRAGIVARVHQEHLDRPVIRVISGPNAPQELDLQLDPELQIAGWHRDPAAAAA